MRELDAMSFEDVGIVVGYMSGKAKGEEKAIAQKKRLQGGGSSSTQKKE